MRAGFVGSNSGLPNFRCIGAVGRSSDARIITVFIHNDNAIKHEMLHIALRKGKREREKGGTNDGAML